MNIMRRERYSRIMTAGVAALVLGAAACGGATEEPAAAAEPAVKTALVRTETPVQQDVVDVVSLSADLEPKRRATLAAEVPGTVERLSVGLGDRVSAGQLLATIDTRALQQQAAEAEALARQAQAQFGRAQALFERRSITQQQMLDAVTGRDVAEARLASVKLNLEKSQVRAPWAGSVAQSRWTCSRWWRRRRPPTCPIWRSAGR
jgi:multidrug efflux pump subunit AcrA (membrane-fusion protein)